MLYYHRTGSPLPALKPMPGLEISEWDDPVMLSVLCGITVDEARRRLANDHRVAVGSLEGKPVAFGWIARGKVRIGELNHEIVLPVGHRYLWNFRTMAEFRGRGIYPRLLQHILRKAGGRAEHFWILHAPENKGSEKGIVRAGFGFAGNVSAFGKRIIFSRSNVADLPEELVKSLGFPPSREEQATCWKCSSPWLRHEGMRCCCEGTKDEVCNAARFVGKRQLEKA